MKLILLFMFCFSLLFANANDEYSSIKSLYFKSYDYEKNGQYEEAIKVLSPLYNKYPSGYTLNYRFGWLFYLNKNYNDAIVYYKKALLASPYSFEVKLGLSLIYLITEKYEDSQTLCYEILKVDYYNYYANIYTISALIYQQKYDLALEVVTKMLTVYPTSVEFLEQLAVIYKATNSKYLQGVYNDILILDPNNVFVRTELSIIK